MEGEAECVSEADLDLDLAFQFEGRWAAGETRSRVPEGRFSVPQRDNIIQTVGTFAMKLDSVFDPRQHQNSEDCFLQTLKLYMKNTSEEKHFYDFKLVCQDGVEIKCHKIILVSQSKYFQGLLGQKECDFARLDFPGAIIQTCIDFLYSGDLQINGDNAQDLLLVSNYLIIVSLQSLCQTFILDRLEVTNCVEVFKLADMTGSQALASRACSVIAFNFRQIFQDEETLKDIPKHLFSKLLTEELIVIRNNFDIILSEADSRREISAICQKYLALSGEELVQEPERCFQYSFTSVQFTSGGHSGPQNFTSRGFGEKYIRSLAVFSSTRPGDSCSLIGQWAERGRTEADLRCLGGFEVVWSDGSRDTGGGGEEVKVVDVPEGDHLSLVGGEVSQDTVLSLSFVSSSGLELGPGPGPGTQGTFTTSRACLRQVCPPRTELRMCVSVRTSSISTLSLTASR